MLQVHATVTKSELFFEKFCQVHDIRFKRIPAGTSKTPDYNIYLEGMEIVIEVKEIDPNPEEQKQIKKFHSSGAITIKSQLGKRIRDKITDATGKFKEALHGNHPSILVLYNNVAMYKHTAPRDILAGMYGQLYFPVSGSPGEPLKIGELKSGPKKKMTPDANTSISAVAVLKESGSGDPDLLVYHNFHARVPLKPLLLSHFNIRQFRVSDQNNPTEWIEIEKTLA